MQSQGFSIFQRWVYKLLRCTVSALDAVNRVRHRVGNALRFMRDSRAVRRRYGNGVRFVKCADSANEIKRWQITSEDRQRLTIVVATYQQELALDSLLKSLVCQTLQNFKVLVIHDGPSVATSLIVNSYSQQQFATIEYRSEERRVGKECKSR